MMNYSQFISDQRCRKLFLYHSTWQWVIFPYHTRKKVQENNKQRQYIIFKEIFRVVSHNFPWHKVNDSLRWSVWSCVIFHVWLIEMITKHVGCLLPHKTCLLCLENSTIFWLTEEKNWKNCVLFQSTCFPFSIKWSGRKLRRRQNCESHQLMLQHIGVEGG